MTTEDLKADADTRATMAHVEGIIVRAIWPYRERIEAAIIIFALVRCARVLLWLYPKKAQAELLPVIVSYFQGKAQQPDASDPASLLWTPNKLN